MSSRFDPLKAIWKSQFFFETVFVDDPKIQFDLRTMTDTGDASSCTHGDERISGQAFIADNPPITHSIKFNTPDGKKFRGFAIRDEQSGEIRKIVGAAKFPSAVRFKSKTAAAAQDEATWVATKNP